MKKPNYVPYLFEKFLNDKEISLQYFFNLESKPTLDTFKAFKSIKSDIKSAISESKEIIRFCDRDELTNAKYSADNIKSELYSIDCDVEEIEKNYSEWEYAYESIENLLLEIINKENIDLSKYSTNMTEREMISYKRIKTIDKLLGE